MSKFRNAILCDDIRDEAGGKNSLMGVFAGDIVVAHLPATINLAFFLQYFPDASDGPSLSSELRLLQDDREMGKFAMKADTPPAGQVVTIILPRGMLAFDKEGTLRMVVSMNGKEEEVLSKKVMLPKPTDSFTASGSIVSAPPASQSKPARKKKWI